jgi:hypothetical protein
MGSPDTVPGFLAPHRPIGPVLGLAGHLAGQRLPAESRLLLLPMFRR